MNTTPSRAVIGFTGASYLCAGLSFSYVHRYAGTFGLESVLWLLWALIGFGGAMWHVGHGPQAGQGQWKWQGVVGLTLAVFPGFFMFNLVRWMALVLMLVIGARAAVMHTRRDFHLTLVVIFAVCFLVATHGGADWTLWFYLGPCWLFAGLALAWEHAAGARLSHRTKGVLTTGFVLLSLAVALLLHAMLPRPNIMGFGFLPPGTDQPGHFKTNAPRSVPSETQVHGSGSARATAPGEKGSAADQGNAFIQGAQAWEQLRQGLSDQHIPAWQRAALGAFVDSLQALTNGLGSAASAVQQYAGTLSLAGLLLWLLAMLIALWAWRHRWTLSARLALLASAALSAWHPEASMRLSAMAASWALRGRGHRRRPGQSVREHWASLPNAPMLSDWLHRGADIYCASRFGSQGFTPARARDLNRAISQVCGVLWAGPKPPKA
jgi:hypothetical protein